MRHPRETAHADLWATGVSPDGQPTRFVREHLTRLGASAGCHGAGGTIRRSV